MKKLLLMIIVFFSLCSVIVYAEKCDFETRDMLTQLNILQEDSFSDSNTVSRKECIVAIMRLIGVTDEDINSLNGADLYTFADTKSYSYEGCAYVGKIAYGEECIVDYPTYRTTHSGKNIDFFFFPERAVTIRETLTFIIRCLEDTKDFNDVLLIETAKKYNLIEIEEGIEGYLDNKINQEDFSVLLGRMLELKKYKYYIRENGVFEMKGNVDKNRSTTYYEFLMECREKAKPKGNK